MKLAKKDITRKLWKLALKIDKQQLKTQTSSKAHALLCKELQIGNTLRNRKRIYMCVKNAAPTKDDFTDNNQSIKYAVPNREIEQDSYTAVGIVSSFEDKTGPSESFFLGGLQESAKDYAPRSSTPNLETSASSKIIVDVSSEETKSSEEVMPRSLCSDLEITPLEVKTEEKVTPEKFAIPRELDNLSNDHPNAILPAGSENVTELSRQTYKDCNLLEGTFQIEQNIWNIITKDNKLESFYSSYYLKNRINKYANNTCTLVIKHTKYLRDKSIKISAICKHNDYRCKKFKIIINNRLSVLIYSSSKNYCHKETVTSYPKALKELYFNRIC